MHDEELWQEGSEAHYVDAAYYDQAYRLRKADKTYYAAEAKGDVLELGAGTGRITLPIARAMKGGARVVGVDAMAPMLDRAEEKLARQPRRVRERVTLIQDDFRTMRLGKRFESVFAPFNALQHLYTREDFEACMETVRTHLAPGGHFHFDVLIPDPGSLARDPNRVYRAGKTTLPSTGRRYHYRERFRYDTRSQVQTIELVFVGVEDPLDLHVVPLTHRQFFPEELRSLLHYCGFEVVRHDGGFEGEALEAQAESQLLVCKAR